MQSTLVLEFIGIYVRKLSKILNIDNLVKNDNHHDFLNFALNSSNSLGLLNSLLYNIKKSGIKKAYIYSIGVDFIKIYEEVKDQILVIDLLDNNKGYRHIKSEIVNVNDLDSIINNKNEVLNFIVTNINYSSNITDHIIKFCNYKEIKYKIINFFTIKES